MTRVIYKRFYWRTVAITVLACGVLVSVVIVTYLQHDQNPLPSAIKSQVHFPVFYPGSPVVVDTGSFKFDKPSGVLSFHAQLADGQVATFTEQVTPDPFNDIPTYYDQFLNKIYEYTAFDSLQGNVHLTHPKNAGQAAVMNAKGTLMFIRVANDEPKSTWQQIFSKFVVYTP